MESRESDVDKTTLGKWEYANYFEVGHNAFEFYFDFGQGAERVKVYTRITTNPIAAQQLCDLLKSALAEYAHNYGTIPSPEKQR